MKKIAISIGDVNGIAPEILLRAHGEISRFIKPIYCADLSVLKQCAKLLKLSLPRDLELCELGESVILSPQIATKSSGKYSFLSFECAFNLAKNGFIDGILTLPINKYAWKLAGIKYRGHTEFLSEKCKKKAIMMLGCEKMFVALFSDHIPLKSVPRAIKLESLNEFFKNFYREISALVDFNQILVLGLNPHSGDNGVLGMEDFIIKEAIARANAWLNLEFKRAKKDDIFIGPISPDIAFSPQMRKNFKIFIAMYHDQGLIPLKALYFDESINISLNLPILRASPDHGVAYDIAYQHKNPNLKSYIEAAKFLA